MEEVTKCSYINCLDSQETEQIFHELPVCNTSLCVRWLINSGHEDLVGKDFTTLRSMRFFVCNNHFTNDCYLAKGTLKENAVPRPHWNSMFRRNMYRVQDTCQQLNALDRCAGRNRASKTYSTYTVTVPMENSHLINEKNMFSHERNRDQWCRTCATRKPDLISMTEKNKQTEMSLLSKLKLLIEIDDEDVLPLHMCHECVTKLEQSFQFFQQIYIADNTLRHVFPSVITQRITRGVCNGIDVHESQRGTENESLHSNTLKPCPRTAWNTSVNNAPSLGRVSPKNEIPKKPVSEVTPVQKQTNTVFSLLADACHNDEELHWVDVLNVLKREERYTKKGMSCKQRIYCEFCDTKFKLRRQLKTHLMSNHANHIDNICMNCIIRCDSKSELLKHRELYHKHKSYVCDYCQKDFSRKSNLTEHIRTAHLKPIYFSCDTCNERFGSKETLFDHIKRANHYANGDIGNIPHEIHDKDNTSLDISFDCLKSVESDKPDCEPCPALHSNADTSTTRSVSEPAKSVISQTSSTQCPECSFNASSVEKLQIHEMQCHLVQRDKLTCLLCEKDCFCSLDEYVEHVEYHCKQLDTYS